MRNALQVPVEITFAFRNFAPSDIEKGIRQFQCFLIMFEYIPGFLVQKNHVIRVQVRSVPLESFSTGGEVPGGSKAAPCSIGKRVLENSKPCSGARLHTAARKSELFRLQWNDVDFERGFIQLGTRKRRGGGMEYDPVPMTSELRRILLEQKAEGLCSDHVFCHTDGTPYTKRQRLIDRLCKKCGIPRFSLHGIRHLTASILANEGVPMLQIQAILRHRRLATTEVYISRISPLENVLEGVFGERKQPDMLTHAEPLMKVAHEVAHAHVATEKLQ